MTYRYENNMPLLSLIGEQPIPNLLVARALRLEQGMLCCTETTEKVAANLSALLPEAEICVIDPYNLTQAQEQIDTFCAPDTVINLTSGTKPMALAAYEVARARGLVCVYLVSEGDKTLLYRYEFRNSSPGLVNRQILGELIDINDYIGVHGLIPKAEKGPQNAQEAGLRRWLEKQVDECRSNLVFDAFEVDFILRRGNRVTLLEAKMSDHQRRKGIDQLNTAGGRAYLGIYTGKIYAVHKPLGPQLTRLAEARNIQVVIVTGKLDHRTGRMVLSEESQGKLSICLDEVLGRS